MSAFPAIVLPLHRSLVGWRVVAFSDAKTNSVIVVDGEEEEKHLVFFNRARIYRRRGNDQYLLVRGDEAMVWNQTAPLEEPTEPGLQRVLPGAGRDNGASMARKRITEPMRPRQPQVPCDVGLFAEPAKQI